jgi:hypothetical protein
MKDFWPGIADRNIRWLPRILGIPIGLFALGEFIEGLGYLGQLDTSGIMVRIGFLLVNPVVDVRGQFWVEAGLNNYIDFIIDVDRSILPDGLGGFILKPIIQVKNEGS